MSAIVENDEILEINDYVSGMFSSLYTPQTINLNLTTHEQVELLNNLERKIFHAIEPDLINSSNRIKNIYNKSFERTKLFYLTKVLKELLKVEFDLSPPSELIQSKKALSYLLGEIGYLDSLDFLNTNESYSDVNLEDLSSNNELLSSYIQKISSNNNFNLRHLDPEPENDKKRDIIILELFNNRYNQYFNALKDKFDIAASKLFKELLFHEITKLENSHIEKFIQYLLYKPKDLSYQKVHCPLAKQSLVLLEHSNAYYLLKEGQKNLCKTLNILISRYNAHNSIKFSLTEEDKNLLLFFIWLKKKPAERIKTIKILNAFTERQNIFALENPNMLTVHLCRLQESINQITNTKFVNPLNTPIEKLFENNLTPEMQYYAEISNRVSSRVLHLMEITLKEEKLSIKKLTTINLANKTRKFFNKMLRFTAGLLVCIFLVLGYYNFLDIEGIYKNNFIKAGKSSLDSIPYPSELKNSKDPTTNKLNQKKRLSYMRDLNSRYFNPLIILLAPDVDLEKSITVINSLSIPSELKDKTVLEQVRNTLSGTISEQEWKLTFKKLFGFNVLTELYSYGAISNFLLPTPSNYATIDRNNMIKMFFAPPEKGVLRKDFIMRHNISPSSIDLEPKNYIDKYDIVYSKIYSNCNLLIEKIKKRKSQLINSYRTVSDSKELKKIRNALSAIAVIEVNLNDLRQRIQERHDYIVRYNTYRLELE